MTADELSPDTGRPHLAGPFEIWADGVCNGNPGPGAWAAIIRNASGKEREITGTKEATTGNQMELTAAIRALEVLSRPSRVILRSDSQYLVKGMTEWLPGWLERSWTTGKGKPVVNRDLWVRLVAAEEHHEVTWEWMQGGAEDEMNKRIDALALAAMNHRFGGTPLRG